MEGNSLKLTERQLRDIAIRAYKKGQATGYLEARDAIRDLREQILAAVRESADAPRREP